MGDGSCQHLGEARAPGAGTVSVWLTWTYFQTVSILLAVAIWLARMMKGREGSLGGTLGHQDSSICSTQLCLQSQMQGPCVWGDPRAFPHHCVMVPAWPLPHPSPFLSALAQEVGHGLLDSRGPLALASAHESKQPGSGVNSSSWGREEASSTPEPWSQD